MNEVVGCIGVQRMTSTEALEDSCKSAKESGVKLERADELRRVVREPCLYSKADPYSGFSCLSITRCIPGFVPEA